jgi:UDP:flavonoid glycosyltransferase YjiC (YdhE family)
MGREQILLRGLAMRAVFMPLPGRSHAFQMVPLAWAMMAAGHDVTVIAGLDAIDVRDAGVAVVDPFAGVVLEDNSATVMQQAGDIFRSAAALSTEQILAMKPYALLPWDRFVDPYVAAAERLRPDLIVHDPVFNAGLIAADALDVPTVGQGEGLLRFPGELVWEQTTAAFERHRVALPKKLAVIDPAPASLMEAGAPTWRMRYVPYNGSGVVPAWLLEPPSRPRIAVTLGTASPGAGLAGVLERVIAAARVLDCEFAVTVTEAAAEPLGPLPDNVRVTGWVPLQYLLRTCVAVVHHGGAGTMFSACAAGIPQLVVPEAAAYEYNARALAGYGCGIPGTPDLTADDVARLVSDEALARAARELAAEFACLPTPAGLVDDIVEFTRA